MAEKKDKVGGFTGEKAVKGGGVKGAAMKAVGRGMAKANNQKAAGAVQMAKVSEKYTQAKAVKGSYESYGKNGYPNNVPNTQTVKTRGTGAATKGTNSSKKLA